MTSVRARLASFLRDPRGRAHLQPLEFPDIMVNPSSLLARTNNLLSVSSGKISSSVFRLMRISRLQGRECFVCDKILYSLREVSSINMRTLFEFYTLLNKRNLLLRSY